MLTSLKNWFGGEPPKQSNIRKIRSNVRPRLHLEGADLSYATVSNNSYVKPSGESTVCLVMADLSHANFSYSFLVGANFLEAIINDANFSHSELLDRKSVV